MTDLQIRPVEPTIDDTLNHIVCCRRLDGNKAFCGAPLTGGEDQSLEVDCVVCIDLGDAAIARNPGFAICQVDGRRCPDTTT